MHTDDYFPGADVLGAPADVDPGDPDDVVTPSVVRAWADAYLPPDVGSLFTEWVMDTFSDWAGGTPLTVGALLGDMLRHWTGRADGYPVPGPDGAPQPASADQHQ